MKEKLKGKVAIVTGASKGIGASIALHLAENGAAVVVNYSSSKEDAEKVVSTITQNGGKAIAIQANLFHLEDIKKLFLESFQAFGKIDILINNAGVYEFKSIEEVSLEHYHHIFDLNVRGLLLATKEFLKYSETSGCIINISSIASTLASANASVYSASKAAVDAITKSLSQELGPRNIRVNSINPGMIETEGTYSTGILKSDFRKDFESHVPLGRIGIPSDVAPAVTFIASDEASWISGETLFITGGYR
ncbi:MAG: glucose 1-dehydrogenase [Parachlamydiaceae bacterium]|nr:glucose 1-dehydrogenase [Parachlamydiaceae bacterium]